MIKVIRDYTKKYAYMLGSFHGDNQVEVQEILEGTSTSKVINNKPFYIVKEELIKNKDRKLMKDIELLAELVYFLENNKLKIVEVDKEKLNNEEII